MSVPFNNNDTVVYDGRDVYLPKDTSVTAFEDSRVFLFGEWYLNGQPLLSGGSLPSGIEVGVGPVQPTDPGIVLWWDTSVGYGELKVKFAGNWKQVEDPTEAGGTLPTASETNPGIVELATPAEALAATDALRAVTPLCLQNYANLTYLGNNYYTKSTTDSTFATKAEASGLYVAKAGDVMTGLLEIVAPVAGLNLKRSGGVESPHMSWWHSSGTPRFGYIMGTASGLQVVSEAANVELRSNGVTSLSANGTYVTASRLRLTATDDVGLASTTHAFQIGADSAANLSMDANEIMAVNNGATATLYLNYDGGPVAIGAGNFTTNGAVTIAGLTTINDTLNVTSTGTGEPLRVQGAATGGYIGFYESTTRRGYCGHYPDTHMSLTADTGYVYIRSGGGYILFQDGGTERMRMNASGTFLVGHTSEGTIETGCEIRGNTSGMIASWTASVGSANLWLSRYSTASANDQPFVTFRSSSTQIGSIVQYGASGVGYNVSSDYRLKDVLGPVTTPIRRLKYLRPWRVKWKSDGMEEDTFLAHEVSAVVPGCVFGEKDAMYPPDHETNPGEINPQMMDVTKMTALVVAGIQELITQVEVLQSKVAALEAG